MSKQGTPTDTKKPASNPAENSTPKSSGPAPSSAHGHTAPSSHKGSAGAKVGCHASGCKEKDSRFNFCDEHFRQFKFGLITKTGEKVLDYERKFEHYQNWLRAQSNSRGNVA